MCVLLIVYILPCRSSVHIHVHVLCHFSKFSYIISDTNGGGTTVEIRDVSGTEANVQGLTPGALYTFSVTSENAVQVIIKKKFNLLTLFHFVMTNIQVPSVTSMGVGNFSSSVTISPGMDHGNTQPCSTAIGMGVAIAILTVCLVAMAMLFFIYIFW